MHNTEYNKENQDDKKPQKKQQRKLTAEESALRHILLFFLVFAGVFAFSLDSSYKSMTDIYDENFVYPFDFDNLDERRREFEEELDNAFKNEKDLPFEHHRRNPQDTPLEDLIANYQLTPHVKVGADEYSGVDKETSNYVWNLLKLDDTLTSQITNRVIIYQNQGDDNSSDTLAEIDDLIKEYKEEIDQLALPQDIKSNTRNSLVYAREGLMRRHDNLREAFKTVASDPKDTSNKVNDLVREIASDRDNAANDLINALRSSKKF